MVTDLACIIRENLSGSRYQVSGAQKRMIIISVYTCVWTCEFVEMPAWKEQQVMIAAFENKRMILFLIFLLCSVFDHCGVTKKY